MPSKPLAISFPVIDCAPYSLAASGRAILLRMVPIRPASPALAPSHCKVTAMLENGKHHELTIPIAVWRAACAAPVFFIEGADVRGPLAASQGVSA